MRCDDVQKKLGALLDQELSGWQRRHLERHLACCAACQQEHAALLALEARLRSAGPLPRPAERRPVLRPIGVVRPALALAACALGLWYALPQPSKTVDSTVVAQVKATPILVPLPSPTPAALVKPNVSPAPVRPQTRHFKVAKRPHRRRLQPAALPEQVVIVVLTPPQPKALTLVHDSQDDEGGTIHIESTIPSAFVAAMQTASLSYSQGELN